MAAKKKTASQDSPRIIVAFALEDIVEGEGEAAKTVCHAGQRLDLSEDEFKALAGEKLCVAGVHVRMKTAVEGRKYSLKVRDETWLHPDVAAAWEKAGMCAPCGASLESAHTEAKTEIGELKAALGARAAEIEDLRAQLSTARLEFAAVSVQLHAFAGQITPVLKDGAEEADLLEGLKKLVAMVPTEDELSGMSAASAD
ncbi:hypothetical protein [Thiosulfatihalobacter marinus]|uniref:hypothetical protein n=1 Tax=Thiosulfatihalobacter marinus TaxID=2792481 RepID=UPI0018D874C9|nr:hypothetical protein [Thiosulfatihalobacter marinus]